MNLTTLVISKGEKRHLVVFTRNSKGVLGFHTVSAAPGNEECYKTLSNTILNEEDFKALIHEKAQAGWQCNWFKDRSVGLNYWLTGNVCNEEEEEEEEESFF